MLEFKEHSEKWIAKIFNFFILDELGVIILLSWELQPSQEIVKSLPVFFDSEPDSNKDEVIIVIMGIIRAFIIRPLSDRVATAVNLYII